MRAAAQLLVGQQREPALDLVEPGRIGRGVVHVETRMGPKPFGDRRGLVGGVVVTDQVHIQLGGDLAVQRGQKLLELGGAMAAVDRSVDQVRRSGSPGIIGSTGAERSSAWIWDFSSTHNTSAFSGGSRYNPTTSRTLSMKWGSVLILNVSTRCGLSPNAFQIRPTVDFDSPDSLAIDVRDQCVASSGWRSRVATSTASICSSPIVRGAPGR